MNKQVCKKFQDLRNLLPDHLINGGSYAFTNEEAFKEYCTDNKCNDDFGKISAGCLYLLDAFFKDNSVFNSIAKSNINIVDYIIIWLSYMLFFIINDENDSIGNSYNYYIYSDNKYNQEINDVAAYTSYKDLIYKKENLMNISIIDMSNFYDVFTSLCTMYVEFDEESPNCDKYLEKAKNFAEAYDALNEDYNYGKGSPYNQLLSTLSNDYCNLKNKCNQFPTLPTYSRRFCESINTIDEYYAGDPNNRRENYPRNLLDLVLSDNKCSSDVPQLISDFIALVTLFNGIGSDENLASDKLVEYAILWLSYKINQKKENGTIILDHFYTEHIKGNDCYNGHIDISSGSNKIYMEAINKKIESMNIDIKDISNFYDAFKSLCNMFRRINLFIKT
ncbi:hypothetical protein YYC_04809 [Plasmodium yoelii 17X]|uniref:YIR protein n=1 Tax=Plasmodium yoelii 17X TaxID=1323249 RepID=V7PCK7_PLAYE|nr:hypothetical protein YYC_04809 [Plasmodium yoelii 17X]